MFIIDFRNTNVSEYRFSIMDNSNVDVVHFYSRFTQYATGTSIYLKIRSNENNYVDKIAIASENISIDDGALLVKWLMGAVSTHCKKIYLQLQFEKEGDIIDQTPIVGLTLGNTINVDELIPIIYPKILEQLRHDIDTEHTTNVTQQGEINANTNKLATIESGAQVNVLEHVFVNDTELAITNKAVSFYIPTKTSQLTNDSDFTTQLYVDTRIDEIEQRSDVVDVVGTYADLEAYDTSHLAPNSLIKVIHDETHDDAITYYRWVITDNVGAWVYVASEGAYYTTTEMDTILTSYVKLADAQTITGIKTFNAQTIFNSKLTLKKTGYQDCEIENPNSNLKFSIFGGANAYYMTYGSFYPEYSSKSLGDASHKWSGLYITGSIYGATYTENFDDIYTTINNKTEASANAEIKWSSMLSFSKSADTTFTFETAKTNCLNEYKALITNSGSNAIALTFTGVTNILTNDDEIAVVSNVMTIPSGVSVEVSCINNKLVAINWAVA